MAIVCVCFFVLGGFVVIAMQAARSKLVNPECSGKTWKLKHLQFSLLGIEPLQLLQTQRSSVWEALHTHLVHAAQQTCNTALKFTLKDSTSTLQLDTVNKKKKSCFSRILSTHQQNLIDHLIGNKTVDQDWAETAFQWLLSPPQVWSVWSDPASITQRVACTDPLVDRMYLR